MSREANFKPLRINWDRPATRLEIATSRAVKPPLGVSMNFTYERNQDIAVAALLKNPYLAEKQIQFLRHFAWIRHIPKKRFLTGCHCLACRLLYDLDLE